LACPSLITLLALPVNELIPHKRTWWESKGKGWMIRLKRPTGLRKRILSEISDDTLSSFYVDRIVYPPTHYCRIKIIFEKIL